MSFSSVDPRLCSIAMDVDEIVNALPPEQREAARIYMLALLCGRHDLCELLRDRWQMHPPIADDPEWTADTVIQGYKLVKLLGRGGFGDVWLAVRDGKYGTGRFALKILRRGTANIEAIKREVSLQQQAGEHSNVLTVFDAFEEDGHAVIVFELASGGSLAELLKQQGGKGLPVLRALTIAEGTLGGMVHVHAHNIVHRDLKPANILLSANGDTPKVADFGLSCIDTDPRLNVVAGTFGYMSPETFSDRTYAPHQADVWAMGVIFDEMVRGRRPYTDANTTWKAPPPLPMDVPPVVQAIIKKALSEKPEDRYQTAAEMLEAVSSALRRTRPLSGPSAAIVVKKAKREWRRRVLVGVGAAMLALVAAAVYFVLFAERVPVEATEFSVPTALHLTPTDLGHRIRNGVVTSVNPRVSDCQARGVGRGVGGLGTLSLFFTVRPDGRVQDVNVDGTAPMDAVMRRCFVRAAAQRQFDNWTSERVVARADYEFVTPPAAPHRAQGL